MGEWNGRLRESVSGRQHRPSDSSKCPFHSRVRPFTQSIRSLANSRIAPFPAVRQSSSFQERLEPPTPGGVPQLAERLRLDLPDALASDGKTLPDFLERVLG